MLEKHLKNKQNFVHENFVVSFFSIWEIIKLKVKGFPQMYKNSFSFPSSGVSLGI